MQFVQPIIVYTARRLPTLWYTNSTHLSTKRYILYTTCIHPVSFSRLHIRPLSLRLPAALQFTSLYLYCMYKLILTCLLEIKHGFSKFSRTDLVYTLCDLLLCTLRDVSQHCSCHDLINFICHHCLTHFDSKGAIAAYMNQKEAHLRQPCDPSTFMHALPSPAPCTTPVLPISQPAPQPTPTLSGPRRP